MGDFSTMASRIRDLRLSLCMTQKEFAEKAGCTAATLSAYENNSKSPSLEIVKNIAENFGVSLDWICGLCERENGSNEPKTYSDIIFMLSEIGRKIDLVITENESFKDANGFITSGCSLHLVDRQLNAFLSSWAKYKNLLNTNAIDEDIYSACMSKLYSDSNVKISDISF